MKGGFVGAMIVAAEAVPQIEARLSSAMRAEVRITECLRAQNGRTIYTATLDGRSVIVKRGVPNAQAIRSEMEDLRGRMSKGPNRVVDCLGVVDDMLVMERAPGRSVQDLLDAAGAGAAQDALLARCGEWAVAYAGNDRETGVFGSGFWLKKRRSAVVRADVAPAMREALTGVMVWMDEWAKRITGMPVTRGRVHGDLTPMNLHMGSDGVLWGFDIGAGVRFPFARELARFMVTWARSSGEEAWDGRRQILALAAPVLTAQECDGILPFFLGEQIAGRLAEQSPDDARGARMRRMASTLLARYP